jgi:hypothetical protein
MIAGFSAKRYILPVKKIDEVIITTAKDKPYNRTTMECLFDLYHEKKILVNNAIRATFKPYVAPVINARLSVGY